MSTVPDGYPPQPPRAGTHPARKLSWRILHSLWLAVPILGFGCLSSTALIYVGVRAGRRSWWVPGVGYLVASSAAFALLGESQESTSREDWAGGLYLATWLACIVHACLINSQWLRWKATHVPWYERLSPAPVGRTSPAGPVTSLIPHTTPASVTSPSASSVDVNTATVGQLAGLPGFDVARASRTVAEREARGGFASMTDFASAAGLAPHELVRVRNQVSCPPPHSTPLSSTPPPVAPPGRILDV